MRDDAALAPRASARSSSDSAGAAATSASPPVGAATRARAHAGRVGQADRASPSPSRPRLPGRGRRRSCDRGRAAGDAEQRDLARWRRSACTWRAARTSTAASASARAARRGRRAGTRRRRAPDDEARQQPALGRAEAGQPRRAGRGVATSLVSWPCRNCAASAPRARITPQSARRQAPPIEMSSGSCAIIISRHGRADVAGSRWTASGSDARPGGRAGSWCSSRSRRRSAAARWPGG